jgi:hypothetical protein
MTSSESAVNKEVNHILSVCFYKGKYVHETLVVTKHNKIWGSTYAECYVGIHSKLYKNYKPL